MEKLTDEKIWDVVVIGAGPAGSVASLEIAKLGCSVLLVDKAKFPRTKICGSCLNSRSLGFLKKIGIENLQSRLNAVSVNVFYMAAKQRHLSLPFSGCSVSREKLDLMLVEEAVGNGVCFLPETRALTDRVENEFRIVTLQQGTAKREIKSRIVLIADGLSGGALGEANQVQVKPKSRMGVGTIVNEGPAFYEPGTIYMAYSARGYVGAVRLEDGRIDIAAALHPSLIKAGIENSIHSIWKEAGIPQIDFDPKTHWLGTPPLTRARSELSGERFFVIGDAAGYTEPFTGEGISWALESAISVAPIAASAARSWSGQCRSDWNKAYIHSLRNRQRISQWLMMSLRAPSLVNFAMSWVQKIPKLANPLIERVGT